MIILHRGLKKDVEEKSNKQCIKFTQNNIRSINSLIHFNSVKFLLDILIDVFIYI